MVVGKNGEKPNTAQLLVRNLSRFISILSGVSDDEIAIHDNLSNTFVVKNVELKKVELRQPLMEIFHLSWVGVIIYGIATPFELWTSDIVLLIVLVIFFIRGSISLVRKTIIKS